jgi:hypothetical protein
MKRLAALAAVVGLAALAACGDPNDPLGAEPSPSYNSSGSEGPDAVIGSGNEVTTASTDSTGAERGPGTYGSGH